MANIDEVMALVRQNNGVLLTSQLVRAGYSRIYITELVNSGKLIRIQRGVYVDETGYVDDYFLLQQKYVRGIYSHETALYLLGFSERIPSIVNMTFAHGRSTQGLKEDHIQAVMVSKNFNVGVSEVARHGENIRVYEIERTLVDLLRPRYKADIEQLIPALKQYARYEKRDVHKLFRYAKLFKVENKVRNYMEVLL